MILRGKSLGKLSVSTCETILFEVVLCLQTTVVSLHAMKSYGSMEIQSSHFTPSKRAKSTH